MSEFIGILGGIIGILGGIGGCIAAYHSHNQLIKIAENQQIDILKVVLEIESQIARRSMEFNKAAKALKENNSKTNEGYFLTAKENYFNALDRLCFCIRKGYIPEWDWRKEYQNMIHKTIEAYEKQDFGNATKYRNMLELDRQWQTS